MNIPYIPGIDKEQMRDRETENRAGRELLLHQLEQASREEMADTILQSESEYQDLIRKYRIALFSTQDCVFEYSFPDDTFIVQKENWNTRFGFIPVNYNEIIYKFYDMITPNEREAFRTIFALESVLQAAREGRETIHYTFPVMISDCSYLWMSFTLVLILSRGELTRLIGCINDVNPQNRDAQITEYMNTHDEITGLLNRYRGEEAVTAFLAEQSPAGKCAFILIDIDNFRTINDTLGHRFGDYVLKMISRKLQDFFGDNAIMMRFGGDEFVVFLKQYSSEKNLTERLDQLRTALNQELLHNDNMLTVELAESFGVSTYPDHGTTFRKLYECADYALYQAKKQGKRNYVIYQSE